MNEHIQSSAIKTVAGKSLREAWDVLRETWKLAWSWKWYYLLATIVVVPVLVYCVRFDISLSAQFHTEGEGVTKLAKRLSRIGRADGMSLALVVSLLISARIFRSAKAARVALCIVLSVLVSGIGVNVLRPAFGRARPYTGDAGAFHGPSFTHQYNSFPSGHSSEAWTVATVVSFAYPPAAIPVAAYAGSIMWARVQLGQHFPVDVMGGAFWGIACALPFGVILRRKNRGL